VAAVGIVLVVLGSWIVVKLGPSGQAQFSATSKAPGAMVITSDVLNTVDVPVRVTATRRDGGAVMLVAGPSGDARAILARSAVSSVSAVHFPSGRVDLNTSGAGPVRDVHTSDVWRLTAKGTNTVALVVDQVTSPETAVVTSGDATALSEVTVTLTWADRAWFFLALAVMTIGASAVPSAPGPPLPSCEPW